MIRSLDHITGFRLVATDGEIGKCRDFLFDDLHWTVRYMVADTGGWLTGRKVLISPISLGDADWAAHRLKIKLNCKQIEDSPELGEHEPVSRQYERRWFLHYGWPQYWYGAGVWGTVPAPPDLLTEEARVALEQTDDEQHAHLRSFDEVCNYNIHATDGNIGSLVDLMVDDYTWSIRYLVVDTGTWLPGKKVLVSPHWAKELRWADSTLELDVRQEDVRHSPKYDSEQEVNRQYEAELHSHYGREGYWTN